MAAAALPVNLPPCPGCAGGGEVNGLPCRECEGTTRARGARRSRLRWREPVRRAALAAAGPAGTLVRWSASLPGLGGAVSVTAGLSVIVHAVFPVVPALGVAFLAGGVFGLLADRRL